MRKRMLCLLTAAVVAWSGVHSFAQADNVFQEEVDELSNENSSTSDSITITYDDPAPSNRYRVEIKWGNMEFHYQPADKVWDTMDLKWKSPVGDTKGSWKTADGEEITDGIPKINVTIKNYSSNAVKAKFLSDGKDFTNNVISLDNGTTLELAEGNPLIEKAQANENPEEKGTPATEKFIIALGGTPSVPLDSEFKTTIPVTCTISAAN